MEQARGVVRAVLSARSHYERLGLAAEWIDDTSRVKRHYRERALRVHPDKCTHPDASRAFRMLTQALECLLDPQAQAAHLASLGRQGQRFSTTSSSSSSSPSPSASKRAFSASRGFAQAYAEALHAARKEAMERLRRQQQQKQQQSTGDEEAQAKKKQQHLHSDEAPDTKRQRTNRSVPFDYANLNQHGRSRSGKQHAHSSSGSRRPPTAEPLKREEEKEKSSGTKAAGFTCTECKRWFCNQAAYDRHQLFASINHRTRRTPTQQPIFEPKVA